MAGDPTGVGSAGLRVSAIDATDREFEYWISALGDGVRAQLVGIRVADAVVDPPHDAWPDEVGELVPDALEETVRRADLQLTAPDPVLR